MKLGTNPAGLVQWLEDELGLLRALDTQRNTSYAVGDLLAARGASRQNASQAADARAH